MNPRSISQQSPIYLNPRGKSKQGPNYKKKNKRSKLSSAKFKKTTSFSAGIETTPREGCEKYQFQLKADALARRCFSKEAMRNPERAKGRYRNRNKLRGERKGAITLP